jgi:hypothetical protein
MLTESACNFSSRLTIRLGFASVPGKGKSKHVILFIPSVIRHSLRDIATEGKQNFAWLCTGDLICRKHASPHLVCLRRLPRRLCRQGAHAYTSIDHVDSRARYCRLDYRRRRDSPVLSAQCRGQISSRRINCIHHWSDFSFVHLAQVQAATAPRINLVRRDCRVRRRVIRHRKIDLDQFDSRLELRSLALSEL